MRLRTLAGVTIVIILAGVVGYLQDPGWPGRLVYPLPHEDLIVRHAATNDLPPSLVAAVIFEESKFNHEARSRKGAVGLMQLLPSTAKWVAKRNKTDLGSLEDPDDNIRLGTMYLHYLVDKYGDTRIALAAYNGGETTVDRWLRLHGTATADGFVERIPFAETREYVRRVSVTRARYQELYEMK